MSFSKPLGNLQKPQWFIRSESNELKTNDNVLSELRNLGTHLTVISIVGSMRTGKSWILGQLAGCDAGDGFDVADGQTAVTNGIWILCRKHPQKQNCVVVFLDTEGLHDPYKNSEQWIRCSDRKKMHTDHGLLLSQRQKQLPPVGKGVNTDRRVIRMILQTMITVSALWHFFLSDIFILNVMQKFDNNDLEKIGFITMISKKLEKIDAQKSFPEFILLLRDVAQVKVKGIQMHPSEYLEDVLKLSDEKNDRFTPKWCIREYCQKRACYNLTQPVEFEKVAELGQIEQPALRDQFKDNLKNLKDHVLEDSDIKRFTNDSPFTISAFCVFAVELTASINEGALPKVSSLQQRTADVVNKGVWDDTTGAFAIGMRDEEKNFDEKNLALLINGIEKLEHNLIPMNKRYKYEKIQEFKEYAQEEYLKVSAEKCRAILVDLLQPLIEDTSYKAPNAKKTFERDVLKIKEKYDKISFRNPEKERIWEEMKKDTKKKTAQLQHADQLEETKNEIKAREKVIAFGAAAAATVVAAAVAAGIKIFKR